jgi:diguanylate cyclase (GGDEF)-like protein
MSIQRKTIIIIVSTLLFLSLIIYLILRLIILDSFNSLELNSLRDDSMYISQYLSDELDNLNSITKDYSNKLDIENVEITKPDLHNLKLNSVAIIKDDLIHYENHYNLDSQTIKSLLKTINTLSSNSGMMKIDDELFLFSTSSIDENFSIIFTKNINTEYINELSYKLGLDINLLNIYNIDNNIIENMKNKNEYIENNNTYINLYSLIKNYKKDSIFLIKISKKRIYYSYGKITLNITAIFIFIACTIINIIILRFLRSTVLHRIIKLSKNVSLISEDTNMAMRIEKDGNDEISTLSENINNMLDALQDSQNNYRLLFENMINSFSYCKALYEKDKIVDFIILEINEEFEKEWNIRKSDIIGNRISDIIPDLVSEKNNLIKSFINVMENSEKLELELYDKNHNSWYNIYAFSPRKDYISTIYFNITKQKENEKIIKKIALSDSLTDLYNRRYFDEKSSYLNKHLEIFYPISIFSIDLDGLKIINDSLGHTVGDNLIRNVSRILRKVFKDTQSIIRTGGDEFCIILTNTNEEDAYLKKKQLLNYVEQYNSRETTTVKISMSIGLATSKNNNENIHSIYVNADNKMYQYKLSQSDSNKSSVIDILLTALSERDYVAEGHVERLVEMTKIILNEIPVGDEEKRNMILLAKMHDLGKIGIPDEILYKPDRLNDVEYSKMKQHSQIGYKIASRSKELSNIANLILHHHENWDGSGYPSKLKNIEIPIECRILSIIDSYDAITSKRPYSNGISKEAALEEIQNCSGTKFDPYIVDIFIKLVKKNKIQYPKSSTKKIHNINK